MLTDLYNNYGHFEMDEIPEYFSINDALKEYTDFSILIPYDINEYPKENREIFDILMTLKGKVKFNSVTLIYNTDNLITISYDDLIFGFHTLNDLNEYLY